MVKAHVKRLDPVLSSYRATVPVVRVGQRFRGFLGLYEKVFSIIAMSEDGLTLCRSIFFNTLLRIHHLLQVQSAIAFVQEVLKLRPNTRSPVIILLWRWWEELNRINIMQVKKEGTPLQLCVQSCAVPRSRYSPITFQIWRPESWYGGGGLRMRDG